MTTEPTEIRNRISENRIISREEVADNAGNWRTHPDAQRQALRGVLREVGIVKPILAYHSARYGGLTLLDGHERMTVGIAWPACILDIDDAEADYLLTVLDPLAAMAGAHAPALAHLMESVRSGEAAVQAMIAGLAEQHGLYTNPAKQRDYNAPDPGEAIATELAKTWQVERGQIWEIPSETRPGTAHRIMCGDSTDAADVATLLAGETVDQLMADPPYGVDYAAKNAYLNEVTGGQRIETPIEGDQTAEITDYREFFRSWLELIPFSPYNTCYIFMQGPQLHNLRLAITDAGLYWSDYLVWVKNVHAIGRKDYHQQHEFIVYAWRDKHRFYGGMAVSVIDDTPNYKKLSKPQLIELVEQLLNDQRTTVIREDRERKNDYHPTMKPADLIARLINDGTQEGAIVFDPFSGSGTTLLQCERTGRAGRAMERSPGYVAVYLERARLIGLEPRRIA